MRVLLKSILLVLVAGLPLGASALNAQQVYAKVSASVYRVYSFYGLQP